jgi:signal transduction histidine kinase
MLARSEQGSSRREATDLATLAAQVIDGVSRPAGGRHVTASLGPAPVIGDPVLLERLIGNLVDNGLRHNRVSGGWVHIATTSARGLARLEVSNSGPEVASEEIEALFEPFTRQAGSRVVGSQGFGLGLSIVAAVVAAHGGRITAVPGSEGGLIVSVDLPSGADADDLIATSLAAARHQ